MEYSKGCPVGYPLIVDNMQTRTGMLVDGFVLKNKLTELKKAPDGKF
jgi:hypothetical protein